MQRVKANSSATKRGLKWLHFDGSALLWTIVVETATADVSQDVVDLAVLESVQERVLWLATSIVHHANKVRSTPSGVKVGGHQASSASMVTMMTSLYFEHMRAPDRVSVKPHAAPVLHAINFLLGRLDKRYLTELRAFGGLQSYPSRAKDPDPVDCRRWRTGTWRVISRSRAVAGTSHLWATRSSMRGPSGRRWSIRWCRASGRCCGSSI
jgi:pyruvate dehydrogenase E1 component